MVRYGRAACLSLLSGYIFVSFAFRRPHFKRYLAVRIILNMTGERFYEALRKAIRDIHARALWVEVSLGSWKISFSVVVKPRSLSDMSKGDLKSALSELQKTLII